MKILHLCSDYSNTPIYEQMIMRIDKYNFEQVIYAPVRSREEIGRYCYKNSSKIKYFYSYILNIFTRINYFNKINKIYNDLIKKININEIDLIHAHFLFSDGGVALKLKQQYNINYIVAVRNADINTFLKYLIHLKKKGIEILENAKKIILISPAYKNKLLKYISPDKHKNILSKIKIIPNGIDDFWFKNKYQDKKEINYDLLKIIYVGEYSRNKNIQTSIKVVNQLKGKKYNIIFNIIGEYGHYKKQILNKISKHKYIFTHKKIIDKTNLLNMYRSSDIFIMPSMNETFGLVYIEAMTQGLPLIYTKGEGIDGYFKDGEIGFAVNCKNVKEIILKVKNILQDYSVISSNCIKNCDKFQWDNIIKEYINIYKNY